MKRGVLVLMATLFGLNTYAQDPQQNIISTRTEISRHKLDTNEVIYDERGQALHYYQYTRLLNTGEYTVRTDKPPGTPGARSTLFKIDPKESQRRFEMLKPQFVIKSPLLQEDKILDVTPLLPALSEVGLDKKAIVLLFWFSDCSPCTENFGSLNDLFKTLPDMQDVAVIAITRDKNDIANAKLIQKPLLYAHLLNGAGNVLNYYQLRSLPSYVVTDKDHVIRFAISGAVPSAMPALKNIIRQVSAQ